VSAGVVSAGPLPRTNRTSLVPPLVLSGHGRYVTAFVSAGVSSAPLLLAMTDEDMVSPACRAAWSSVRV
jgi:hypothetical protein